MNSHTNIQANIISFSQENEKSFPYSSYTVYHIEISINIFTTFLVYRRYKEFSKLHKALSSKGYKLSLFPRKSLLYAWETVKQDRQDQLEKYLKFCLFDSEILQEPELRDFLQLKGKLDKDCICCNNYSIFQSTNISSIGTFSCGNLYIRSQSFTIGSRISNKIKLDSAINLSINRISDISKDKCPAKDILLNLDIELSDNLTVIKSLREAIKLRQWPDMSYNQINLLFFGNKEFKGLFDRSVGNAKLINEFIMLIADLINPRLSMLYEYYRAVINNCSKKKQYIDIFYKASFSKIVKIRECSEKILKYFNSKNEIEISLTRGRSSSEISRYLQLIENSD